MTDRPSWRKECTHCGASFFSRAWNARYCAEHRGQAQKDYQDRHRDRRNAQWRGRYAKNGYIKHIAYKYGVTAEWYEERAERGCAVCGVKERLVVDHDHETGAARDVLCNWCNVALGNARDSAERLRELAVYIERFK